MVKFGCQCDKISSFTVSAFYIGNHKNGYSHSTSRNFCRISGNSPKLLRQLQRLFQSAGCVFYYISSFWIDSSALSCARYNQNYEDHCRRLDRANLRCGRGRCVGKKTHCSGQPQEQGSLVLGWRCHHYWVHYTSLHRSNLAVSIHVDWDHWNLVVWGFLICTHTYPMACKCQRWDTEIQSKGWDTVHTKAVPLA